MYHRVTILFLQFVILVLFPVNDKMCSKEESLTEEPDVNLNETEGMPEKATKG